jgi:hypothetical protein
VERSALRKIKNSLGVPVGTMVARVGMQAVMTSTKSPDLFVR